jgi:ribulose-phosphate 3-epimerase
LHARHFPTWVAAERIAAARAAIAAGADVLVAGTATFRGGADNYAENIRGLRG